MKILVTWGAGFIWSHLVDALTARGDEVFILDNLSTGSRANISQHYPTPQVYSCMVSPLDRGASQVKFFEADITDVEKINEIFQSIHPDVVFHLAAHISVRESIRDPHYDANVNILGSINISEAMRTSGCPRIIFSSTGGAMYGGNTPPYNEIQEARPETPYGISKRSVELFLEFYARQYGFRATMLRYSNVYWPRQNAEWEAGVVAVFQDTIKKGEAPTIYWDGNQTRDFIHVADVVSANIHALEEDLTGIYHVGTWMETSINELWKILAGDSILIPKYAPALWEIQRTALDCTKLRSTWWEPKYSLRKISDL